MINFSEINNHETPKSRLITQMTFSTGLPESEVTKLYEQFSFNCDGDLKKINESFVDFIKPKGQFDLEGFKAFVIDISSKIANADFDKEKREQLTDNLIQGIEHFTGICADVPTIIEVICYILSLKNEEKFQAVQNKIQFGFNMKNLFESENIDFKRVNVLTTNAVSDNLVNASEDKKLYSSLKHMLAKNTTRYGSNYHLDSTYQAIVSYLDNEILELTNMDNMVSVSNTFHMTLINELLKQEQMNPMYRSHDVLKTLVPDFQTLVFDMMVLVDTYFQRNSNIVEFISRKTYLEYIGAAKLLFANISSSKMSSQVLLHSTYDNKKVFEKPADGKLPETMYGLSLDSDLCVDYEKLELYNFPVSLNAAVNMVHIIKACTGEFNLKIRASMNNYVTKAIEVLVKSEKIIINRNIINKYK